MSEAAVATIPEEAWAPRSEEERYGLYLLAGDDDLRLLATGRDGASVGAAIVTLDDDARQAGYGALYDLGRVGVLDRIDRRWIVLPWPRGATG